MNILPIAEAAGPVTDITSLITFLSDILSNAILPLLITLAVIGFVFGIIKYLVAGDNEEKRKKGKEFMTWGLVSLFVMVSFWGIISIFQKSFNVTEDGSNIRIPRIPESN